MKKRIVLIVGLALMLTAGAAMAADNFNLTVTAEVFGTCRFTTAAGTLDIGVLDFDASGASLGKAAGSVADLTMQYWCTKGVVYDIQDPGGSFKTATVNRARTLTSATTTDSIPYTLILTDAGRNLTDVPATKTTVTIDASVAGGSYDSAGAANDYVDTLLISITP